MGVAVIEIYPTLFVGNDEDVRHWTGAIVHAAQRPWFKDLNLPPHYLWYESEAEPQSALYLNLVDADKVEYISIHLIEKALDFINIQIKEKGNKILLHCNLGISRSPSIGYLYLLKYTAAFSEMTFEESIAAFQK